MRHTLLLLLILATAACEDALGPAGGCTREMRQTRNAFGDDFTSNDGNDGDVFWETWLYPPRGNNPGRTVTFRWGISLNGCQVTQGPATALIPSR